MKKVILMVAAVLICSVAGAQSAFKLDKGLLLKAIEKSDQDIVNPKRSLRGQTWLDRGDAMFNAAGFMLTKTYPGQPEKDLFTALGKAEPASKNINGMDFRLYSYPYADVYLYNGVVQFWEMKDEVYAGAEDKAVEAYKKAAELDPKLLDKARQGVENVGSITSIAANADYNLGNEMAAAEHYWKAFNVKKEPLVGKIDSISVYNAGSIMLFAEKYDRAIEILQTALDNNVWEEGRTPYYLSYALKQTEQYDRAKEVLTKSLEMFPGHKELIESMVDYYAATDGDFNEIKSMLEDALKADDSNLSVWNGLGQIYLGSGEIDQAIEFYTRYVTRFPESAQANYYLGDVWYEKGDRLLKAAEGDRTMSKATKDAAVEKAKDAYRQAFKYLNVSYAQRPEERATIQRLMFVSIRLIDDPGMEEFNKKIEAEYKAAMGE